MKKRVLIFLAINAILLAVVVWQYRTPTKPASVSRTTAANLKPAPPEFDGNYCSYLPKEGVVNAKKTKVKIGWTITDESIIRAVAYNNGSQIEVVVDTLTGEECHTFNAYVSCEGKFLAPPSNEEQADTVRFLLAGAVNKRYEELWQKLKQTQGG